MNASLDFAKTIIINKVDIAEAGVMLKQILIKNWFFDMVPRLELVISDTKDFFNAKSPLNDSTEIEIIFQKNKDSEKQTKNKVLTFSILNWEIVPLSLGGVAGHSYLINAYLKVDGLFFPKKTRSFGKKSGGEVIAEIASELGLDYNKKFDKDTNDSMKWLQVSQSNHDMLRYINKKTYLNDDDTTLIYVNFDGELVHTSLKTETESEVSFKGYQSQERQADGINENFKDAIKQKSGKKDIPTFYYSYALNKTYAHRNKLLTYKTKATYYNGSEPVEVIPADGIGDKLLNKLSQRSKENIDSGVASFGFGILNGGDNFSEGVHPEFFTSEVRNNYTMMNFFKNEYTLKIKGNDEIKLMDIVDIHQIDSLSLDQNVVTSGKYLVGGIVHILEEEAEYSVLLILYRSGINTPEYQKGKEINLE